MNWFLYLAGLGLILILGLAGGTLWLRSRVLIILRDLRSRLREIDGEARQIDRVIQQNLVDQIPAPLSEQLLIVKNDLDELTADLQKLYQRYGNLRQYILKIFPLNKSRLIQSPLDWYQSYLNGLQLSQDLDYLEQKCQIAKNKTQDIREIGWILGQRLREVYMLYQDSAQIIEELVEKGVHGSALEDAAEQVEIIGNLAGKLPVYFLSENKSELLRLCNKEDIEKIYDFLEQKEDDIRKIFKRVSYWQDNLNKSYQQMLEIQNKSDILSDLLSKAPNDLDIDKIATDFQLIQTESQALDKQLMYPAVDSLTEIAKKSYRTMRMLGDMEKSVQEAIGQLKIIHKLDKKLNPQFMMLEEEIAKIDRNPIYKVLLEESRAQFNNFRDRFHEYCDNGKEKKKPDELPGMVDEMIHLNEDIARLIEHLQELRKQHADLLMLLRLIDVPQAINWCSEVEGLVQQIQQYDPANFSHKEDLRITPDLETLKEILTDKLPQDAKSSIPEKDLRQVYKQAFTASELYQVLKDQVTRVQNEFDLLKKTQEQQETKFEGAVYILKQLRLMAENNSALEQIFKGEVSQLLSRVEKQQTLLRQTQKGVLAKKIGKSEPLFELVYQKCNTWLDFLIKEVDRLRQDIDKLLQEVEKITHLDDPILLELSELLSDESETLGRKIVPGMTLEEIIEYFQTWNDRWQKLAGFYPRIVKILRPVLLSYNEMVENRQRATRAINETGANIQIRRMTSFQQMEREFLDLEHELDRIRTNRYRGLFLSSRLKEFSVQYQDLTIRIMKLGQRVESHRNRLQLIKGEIDSSITTWKMRLDEYQDNPIAKKEISQLIVDAQNNIQRVESDFSQAGELSQQHLSMLASISRGLKDKIVPIGNQQWINIEGKIQGYS